MFSALYTASLVMSGTYEKIILARVAGTTIFLLDLNDMDAGWTVKTDGKKAFGVHGTVVNVEFGMSRINDLLFDYFFGHLKINFAELPVSL